MTIISRSPFGKLLKTLTSLYAAPYTQSLVFIGRVPNFFKVSLPPRVENPYSAACNSIVIRKVYEADGFWGEIVRLSISYYQLISSRRPTPR
jgi:hypothetical protein